MSTKAELTERILDHIQVVIAGSVLMNERIARSLGLNVVDLQTFGMISRAGRPLTAGEISALTELPSSTTTRVLDRLEHRGFIERGTDPRDRRRVVIQVRADAFAASGAGEGAVGDYGPYTEVVDAMRHLHDGFTINELQIIERYLDRLKDIR